MIGIDQDRLRGAVKRIKQKTIATRLGITQASVSRRLKDTQALRLSQINEICEIIGINPSEIITFKEKKGDIN